uniref:Uncharacterized protein n=1 Tax=Plectus sambesii TaxID=2011161 RepID=A0A914V171_9BILA
MNPLASGDLQQPVSPALEAVRAQLDALPSFKDDLQPMAKRIDQLLSRGHDLIKSAGPGVDTSQLDSELNKLGDAWNELKSRVTDRERKLDGALLGLGNYNDASKALLNWLEETEEMVNNQKPPSPDSKVVKAQLQGYDVILKHIDEKQSSVDGFVAMVDKVESLADGDVERNNLRDRADDIVRRYDDLVRVAHDRRNCLQETLELAEQWSDSLRPVVGWLDATERKLQELGSVPTDEDKLREQIDNQKMLQEEIDSQRPAFDDLVELCPRLAALVSNEDADDLESVLRTVVNRYDRLGTNAQACGMLLEEMAAGISMFLSNTEALKGWIDEAEQRIAQFDPIAVYPDALQEQSAALVVLAGDVAEQQVYVTEIIEEGRELCKHTSGDEAIALQGRLDSLRQRYSDLSKRTDEKLGEMEEALPLAEQYHDGHQAVVEWLDAIESDL